MSESTTRAAILPDLPATIHMVGIGGIGVSGLARILHRRGYTVRGSDLSESPTVDELRALGIPITIGHASTNVDGADLVVVTAAARDENPEIAAAHNQGIPVIKRAGLLGELASSRICLAVAGSHGKSTTAGMLAWVLTSAGQSPSFAVGATIQQLGANAGPGDGHHFVVEADEYDYSFLTLRPDVAIITNIEFDHPDLFSNSKAVDDAFQSFVQCLKPDSTLVMSSDDPGCRRLFEHLTGLSVRPKTVTVGRDPVADWRLDEASSPATLHGPGGVHIRLDLSVPGAHNRTNAAMVFAVCMILEIDTGQVLEGLSSFSGVGRRFEYRGEAGGALVFDDYAHHPTEVRATIAAARERYPGRSIKAIFQPHTYSRTRELLREFAAALDEADDAALVEIYPARETDNLGISSNSIAACMDLPVVVYSTPRDAALALVDEATPNDVILFMGAGDIWQASRILVDEYGARVTSDDERD